MGQSFSRGLALFSLLPKKQELISRKVLYYYIPHVDH